MLLNQFVSLTKNLKWLARTTHFPAETELHYEVNQTPGNSTAEETKLHKWGIIKYREKKWTLRVWSLPCWGYSRIVWMQNVGPVWSLPTWPILGLCDPEKRASGSVEMPSLIVSSLVRNMTSLRKDGLWVEKEKGTTAMTHRHGVETKNNTPFQAEMASWINKNPHFKGSSWKESTKKRRNNNPSLQPFSGRLIWAVPLRFLWRSLFSHRIYVSAVQLIHSQGT